MGNRKRDTIKSRNISEYSKHKNEINRNNTNNVKKKC